MQTPHRTETKKSEANQAEGGGFGYRGWNALLAKVSEAEAAEWRDYAKRWWRRYAQQMVEA